MPRMIDLIRASAVPATLVQSASKGARWPCPADETIEILVYLATQSKIFGEQARMTPGRLGTRRRPWLQPPAPKHRLRCSST